MAQPIGIKFLPGDEAAADGPRQGDLAGVPEAFKILSLKLPRRPAFRGIAPPELLHGQGAAGLPGGVNPMAAVFEALLKASAGGGVGMPSFGPSAASTRVVPGVTVPPPPPAPPLPVPSPGVQNAPAPRRNDTYSDFYGAPSHQDYQRL